MAGALPGQWRTANSPLFCEYLDLLNSVGATSITHSDREPLGPEDALLVIDMQNDFLPSSAMNPEGGRMGTPESEQILEPIVHLMNAVWQAGGTVICTRDYHPCDHCSFNGQGGPFPPHCVQGTPGSELVTPISDAMKAGLTAHGPTKACVAFKGFHEDIDSFGGLPYHEGHEGRVSMCKVAFAEDRVTGCTAAPWTGALVLKCSAFSYEGNFNVNAPPDVMAITHGVPRGCQNLTTKLRDVGAKRLIVVGLVTDFCVCDTALNAKLSGFEDVTIALDACRAVHISGVGKFGSGYVADPAEYISKWAAAGIRVCPTAAVTGIAPPE
eukprot:NODE_11775_length_1265_cov_19.304921.p1 GENE.NODE_11775_length_1265_cov_19.304921~~NODE_11775_length_1265_cov_19.304921.p1  ORF type:complete len:326 (-),score=67.27 NODE_11775_length_1265_cov_19.304921:191-1168(-)